MTLHPTAHWSDDAVRWHAAGHWGTEPLGAAFARTCAARGEAVALVDGGRRLTFADWDRQAAAVAGGLRGLGIGAGDGGNQAAHQRRRHSCTQSSH